MEKKKSIIVTLLKIISVILAIVGITFILPIIVALVYHENDVILPFFIPMIASIIFMLIIMLSTKKYTINLSTKQTFIVVAFAWATASLMGSIPFYFSGYFASYPDALFESVSGFSTTGSTILSDVEVLPRSINLWRCLTHWLGGMGIVTLTVALMPLLGVGGFQLIKAETTGPEKGKVTARITTTAKVLWIIYFSLTAIETIALKIAGMDFVDALSHAFSTLGTGGFSTRNDSIGAYNSVAIESICIFFMFLAGINFSLFFYLLSGKFKDIRDNSEFKAYIGVLITAILAITLCNKGIYGNFGKSLRYSSFQVLSIISTTGFATTDFLNWPSTAQFFIFLLFFTGGCSGSTSGGVKIVRWSILCKQVNNETRRMLHPHGVFTIRLNNRVGRKDIVFSVTSFIAIYLLFVAITTFVGCLGKLDIFSAFTGALTMVGNIGPGFGSLGPSCNFGFLPVFVKLWYCFAMLAGRLELYTMIIFFMPSYWKK